MVKLEEEKLFILYKVPGLLSYKFWLISCIYATMIFIPFFLAFYSDSIFLNSDFWIQSKDHLF